MPITLKIFNRSAARPTLYASRDFDRPPVSIGRDSACTMVLDDPHKHISRFHVEIEEEGGNYWMSVVSKVNPVMVKGRRYGPGTRLTLKSGDAFEGGEYEIQVMLAEGGVAAARSLFEEPTFVGAANAPAAAASAPQEAARTAEPAPRPAPAAPARTATDLLRLVPEAPRL